MNKGERQGKTQERSRVKSNAIDDETLAIGALRFFGADPGRAERFFTWSGLDAGTIRAAASQPGFGLAILQFLMQDEPMLMAFAEHVGVDPAEIAAAGQSSLSLEAHGADEP